MKRIALVLATALAALLATPAMAGGYGHRGHHGHHGHHYGRHHFGPRIHHGYRHGHRHHRTAHYVGAGLLLGAVAHAVLQPRTVVRTRVIERRPAETTVYREPVPAPQSAPAPIERPEVYLRKDPNGDCWLIERGEDGTEIISPQDPSVCG